MSEAKIRTLYETRLQTFAEQYGIAIQFENFLLTPPNNADVSENVYLRAFLLFAPVRSRTLAGDDREYRGAGQINVVSPINIGSARALEVVEQLVDLFPNNLRLTAMDGFSVQVITPMSVGTAIPDDTTFTIPMSFTFQANA